MKLHKNSWNVPKAVYWILSTGWCSILLCCDCLYTLTGNKDRLEGACKPCVANSQHMP